MTTRDELLNKFPLIKFSVYTEIHGGIVRELGQRIVEGFDRGITLDLAVQPNAIKADGGIMQQCYGEFWLWVLGAYEVLRTMKSAKSCFSETLSAQVAALEQRVKTLRIPFAKQELAGRRFSAVSTEPSYTICAQPPSLLFDVLGERVVARTLILDFESLFASIAPADVLANLRTTARA